VQKQSTPHQKKFVFTSGATEANNLAIAAEAYFQKSASHHPVQTEHSAAF